MGYIVILTAEISVPSQFTPLDQGSEFFHKIDFDRLLQSPLRSMISEGFIRFHLM